MDAEPRLELDQQVEEDTVAALGVGDQARDLPEVGLFLARGRSERGRVDGAVALGEDAEAAAAEQLAGIVLDPGEVLGALDEDVGHRERGVERQRGVVASGADLLRPDPARDVEQQAAAVALAVDVAGAVEHLLQGRDRELDRPVARRRVPADRGVDRAGVLVLDARRRDPRPVGKLGGVALDGPSGCPLAGGDAVAAGLVALHFDLRVPRLLRAGARRKLRGQLIRRRGGEKSGPQGARRGRKSRTSRLFHRMGGSSGTAEEVIAAIASSSHGVVTRRGLLRAGISGREIDTRIRRGSLIRVHFGVYRAGHAAPNLEARYIAAVLACGDQAVLSGRASGFLWALLKGRPPPPEVTAPTERRVKGISCRECRALDPADLTTCRGIPVTTVPRTLVDLSAPYLPRLWPAPSMRPRFDIGQRRLRSTRSSRGGPTPPAPPSSAPFSAATSRSPSLRSSRASSRCFAPATCPSPAPTSASALAASTAAGPPTGWSSSSTPTAIHASRQAWEEDRRRERLVRARGDEFRRYTWGDVFETPALMLRELRDSCLPHE